MAEQFCRNCIQTYTKWKKEMGRCNEDDARPNKPNQFFDDENKLWIAF